MIKQTLMWEETLFRFIGYPYQIVSLFIGIIILLIYFLFSLRSPEFFNIFYPFEIYHFLQTSASCILIALELGGIQYLINSTKDTIAYLDELSSSNYYITLIDNFKKIKSRLLLYILIILPFIIIRVNNGPILQFYYGVPTYTNLILDIYNYLIEYLSLFLLSDIVWILLNISLVFEKMRSYPHDMPLKSNVFSLYLKLKPINYFILKVLAYYFLIITVAIISYVTPFEDVPYQWAVLIILLLAGGLIFFIEGMGSVRRLLDIWVESELDEINCKRQDQLEKIKEVASVEDYSSKEKINSIATMMEILHTQEEQIIENYNKAFSMTHTLTAIGAFITTSLIPLIALLNSIFELQIFDLFPK